MVGILINYHKVNINGSKNRILHTLCSLPLLQQRQNLCLLISCISIFLVQNFIMIELQRMHALKLLLQFSPVSLTPFIICFIRYGLVYGQVMVESSDRMWSTGEGNGKPHQYSCLENPMNRMKRQKYRTLKDELPRSLGAQYATGDQWRNNSRKN